MGSLEVIMLHHYQEKKGYVSNRSYHRIKLDARRIYHCKSRKQNQKKSIALYSRSDTLKKRQGSFLPQVRFLALDKETILSSVKKTGRVLIVHEACKRAGFGAEIAAILAKEAFDFLDAPIERLGARNTPMPFSPNLEDFVIPKVDDIVDRVKKSN